MNKPRIRQRFSFYRSRIKQLENESMVVDRHQRRDFDDLKTRIEELKKERDFYKNNGHYF